MSIEQYGGYPGQEWWEGRQARKKEKKELSQAKKIDKFRREVADDQSRSQADANRGCSKLDPEKKLQRVCDTVTMNSMKLDTLMSILDSEKLRERGEESYGEGVKQRAAAAARAAEMGAVPTSVDRTQVPLRTAMHDSSETLDLVGKHGPRLQSGKLVGLAPALPANLQRVTPNLTGRDAAFAAALPARERELAAQRAQGRWRDAGHGAMNPEFQIRESAAQAAQAAQAAREVRAELTRQSAMGPDVAAQMERQASLARHESEAAALAREPSALAQGSSALARGSSAPARVSSAALARVQTAQDDPQEAQGLPEGVPEGVPEEAALVPTASTKKYEKAKARRDSLIPSIGKQKQMDSINVGRFVSRYCGYSSSEELNKVLIEKGITAEFLYFYIKSSGGGDWESIDAAQGRGPRGYTNADVRKNFVDEKVALLDKLSVNTMLRSDYPSQEAESLAELNSRIAKWFDLGGGRRRARRSRRGSRRSRRSRRGSRRTRRSRRGSRRTRRARRSRRGSRRSRRGSRRSRRTRRARRSRRTRQARRSRRRIPDVFIRNPLMDLSSTV